LQEWLAKGLAPWLARVLSAPKRIDRVQGADTVLIQLTEQQPSDLALLIVSFALGLQKYYQ
jgi:hypothetical protein